ncbi:hypothetical protein OG239_41325 [Streptomyces sp. NBC_00868]|uniref:hypothetical protein n=1 Tax=unclassified Streptomyces TaxID=2593676 RepID=UPI00324A8876|nr:hypothetical protein OG239_41325 [Streptomyces sp. NBC_00868]
MQSLATQAGLRAFEAARATARRVMGRHGNDELGRIHRLKQVVIEETAAGLNFIVPPDLSDGALATLAATDLEALAAPAENGQVVTIYWDEQAAQWQRHVTDT